MPVLINTNSGLAEDLPQDQALSSLQQETHEIPLNDPQGNPVTASSFKEAKDLLSQGYSQPSSDQLKTLMNYAKYSSTPEQVKTGLEGAASAASFGLSTAAETGLGISTPEEVQARRETNPGVYALGEAGGLAASSLLGYGEGALAARVGELGASAIGLGAAESTIAKAGSMAVRMAIENSLISSGDEVSRMFAKDPNQTAETAALNIGLSGLIGAGLGGGAGGISSPLWKAVSESKLGQFLDTIKNKADGFEKAALPKPELQEAAKAAGIEMAPEINAALSENPVARDLFSTLQESTTKSGHEAQASLQNFKNQSQKSILNTLGKSPDDLVSLSNLSDFEQGSKLQNSLENEIKNRVGAFSEKFNKVKEEFSQSPFPDFDKTQLANQLAELNQKYAISPSSTEFKKINTILEELPNVKTLEDFRNFQSSHLNSLSRDELYNISGPVKNAFRNTEENIVEQNLAQKSPELLNEHQQARALYSQEMSTLDSLNDRLKTGHFSNPNQFISNLKDMNPETLLNRITKTNDVNLLNLLQDQFPETLQGVKDSFLNKTLSESISKAKPGELLNSQHLFNSIDKWSPELKNLVLPPESQNQLSSIKNLLDALPERMNSTGAAKTLDALWSKGSGGAMAMLSMISGHNPVSGYILGKLGEYVARDVPDAIKLATLKFLGSSLPTSAAGFRALAEFASQTAKGEKIMTDAVKTIFKSSSQISPQYLHVDEKKREMIKQKLDQFKESPEKLLDNGNNHEINYYLPNEGAVISSLTGRATQYLNLLKPDTSKMGVLGPNRIPSDVEVSRYNKAIDIAEKPLIVLDQIKKGTLTPDDINTLHSIYPALYSKLSQKLTDEMISHTSKDQIIPYSQRMSLSLFLGQPLDNTMNANAIQATQPMVSPPQNNPIASPRTKFAMKSISNFSKDYQTKIQSRESSRLA